MTSLDTSKSELNENLPFYINDYDEQNLNFICLRLFGNLTYNSIISADYSHTEQQLNDQFERISNDLQNFSFLIKSSNLILSSKENKKIILAKTVKNCSDIYQNYHKKAYENTTGKPKLNLTVNMLYFFNFGFNLFNGHAF